MTRREMLMTSAAVASPLAAGPAQLGKARANVLGVVLNRPSEQPASEANEGKQDEAGGHKVWRLYPTAGGRISEVRPRACATGGHLSEWADACE